MDLRQLDEHLLRLGGRATGSPVEGYAWSAVGVDAGSRVGGLLQWLVGRYGGSSFGSLASYREPRTGRDVLLGWILDLPELLEARSDLADALPSDLVPFENDGADNYLLVRTSGPAAGQVVRYLHDAPADRQPEVIDDSLEGFLAALHPGG